MNESQSYPTRKYQVYIAAPFFNPYQITVLEQVEMALASEGITYFSPLREGGIAKQGDEAGWKRIFDMNVSAIVNCSSVVAVLTYEGVDLYGIHQWHRMGEGEAKLISIPDTGTVWEMGVAHACHKPVVGYFPEGTMPKKLNVMLAHCLVAVCNGTLQLLEIAPSIRAETLRAGVPAWKGGLV